MAMSMEQRERARDKRYDLDPGDYANLLARFDGTCWICRQPVALGCFVVTCFALILLARKVLA